MSHWDEKKPTRYRAKAGPEVVLRKVSVLFAISSMPKRAIGRRKESFSERTILFALNLLCRKRAIEQTGQSRFEKGTRPFLYKFYAEFFIYSECRIFIWRFYLLTYIGEVVVPVKT